MFAKCPKCGYARQPQDATAAGICPACGLVFAKFVQRLTGHERVRARASDEPADRDASRWARVRAALFYVEERVDPVVFYGRCALYAAFLVWGLYFISLDLRGNEIGDSFMHQVNLVFHEAGHVLFMPFGHFMMVLGGTLGQLLMPVIVGVVLVLKNRDPFGGSIALWWFAQSVMDTAPYINDARDLQLMLLGGGTGRDLPGVHDWENILLDLGLIEYERAIALGADRIGEGLMLLAFAWGARVLWRQRRNLGSGFGGG